MWILLLICIAMMGVSSSESVRIMGSGGGSGSSSYDGGSDGSSTGDYGNGAYAGGNFEPSYAPDSGFGFIDPYDFHQQLTAQIHAQHAAQNHQIHSRFAAHRPFFDANRHQTLFNNNRIGSYQPNRSSSNHAAASASIGPGGYDQTSFISPGNANGPNVQNRFGEISSPGGRKSVSASSFSSSANVGGKRVNHRGSQTTVNDNGKVTTTRVHS